ncbi:lysosomal protective protein-like isoform X1 [Ornithodoros turicata]|uniref:lysosomal protective protein-like isoform X1 n=1 Tax=Ornithodoros turicata TaxID=34597 RepID=UPI0031393870
MKVLFVVIVTSLLFYGCSCKSINDDEVTHLPGLEEQPQFRHYSGYLKAGSTRKLHYWFVESQGNPQVDPVVLWLNGGPGCSSLMGLLTELGPFRIDKKQSQLHLNPFSWNKVANVLFLESPAGVGFSYDPSKPIDYDYGTNDDQTADDNYLSIVDFFRKFPNFQGNEFYATGESYAGVYVPMLVQRILDGDNDINLKGYAIGNGYLDKGKLAHSKLYFGYYHGLWSSRLWRSMITHCCKEDALTEECRFLSNNNTLCAIDVNSARQNMVALNPYNIYAPCERGASDPEIAYIHNAQNLYMRNFSHFSEALEPEHLRAPPCTNDRSITEYLNRKDVKAALHVEESPLKWVLCNRVVRLHYAMQYGTMKGWVWKVMNTGRVRALIYNGDFDAVCSYIGDEWFVDSLGYEATSGYEPWFVDGQVAGYYRTHKGNLTFLTVKGAGHMVPEDKPQEALQMITRFLKDEPY